MRVVPHSASQLPADFARRQQLWPLVVGACVNTKAPNTEKAQSRFHCGYSGAPALVSFKIERK